MKTINSETARISERDTLVLMTLALNCQRGEKKEVRVGELNKDRKVTSSISGRSKIRHVDIIGKKKSSLSRGREVWGRGKSWYTGAAQRGYYRRAGCVRGGASETWGKY